MTSPSSPFARVAQLRASLAAFSIRVAQLERDLDDSLEPLRADNRKRGFAPLLLDEPEAAFFKSQSATGPMNPQFEQKHARQQGGKFAAKGTGQSAAAGSFTPTGARQMPPLARGMWAPRPKAKAQPSLRPANLAGLVLPKSRGRWIGERGNGVWLPRSLKARAIAPGGVEFSGGFPRFEPHLHHIEEEDATGRVQKVAGEVEMPSGFVGERPKDFAVADRIIAQKMGCLKRDGTPNAAKAERYRVENRLVWHHHEDCARPRMLLIPAVVHARAPHSGGHSLCAPSST